MTGVESGGIAQLRDVTERTMTTSTSAASSVNRSFPLLDVDSSMERKGERITGLVAGGAKYRCTGPSH